MLWESYEIPGLQGRHPLPKTNLYGFLPVTVRILNRYTESIQTERIEYRRADRSSFLFLPNQIKPGGRNRELLLFFCYIIFDSRDAAGYNTIKRNERLQMQGNRRKTE